MKKQIKDALSPLVLFLISCGVFFVGFSYWHNTSKISPTLIYSIDSINIYIPVDLEDCHKELDKALSFRVKTQMKLGNVENMVSYHFGLGAWMRNNWGLWGSGDSHLRGYFHELGIFHPDDMSGIILDSYWHHLNDKEFDLQKEVDFYIQYWENIKNKE